MMAGLFKKRQEHYHLKGSQGFHGSSFRDRSSDFIDNMPKRSGYRDLKPWQAREHTNRGGVEEDMRVGVTGGKVGTAGI